jgi:hypothetical protein
VDHALKDLRAVRKGERPPQLGAIERWREEIHAGRRRNIAADFDTLHAAACWEARAPEVWWTGDRDGVNSATGFAAGDVEDLNAAIQWQPVLRALRSAMQQTSSACVLLHHTKKSTGHYRDSSQLGAGVDVILEMAGAAEDATVRRVRAQGRVRTEDFTIRYVGERYVLDAKGLPLESRICRAIEGQPGIGLGKLRQAVGGESDVIDAEVLAS